MLKNIQMNEQFFDKNTLLCHTKLIKPEGWKKFV